MRRVAETKNTDIDVSPMPAVNKSSIAGLPLLGILPLLFFSAQAVHYWQTREFGHVLWMCNIGNLLLAFGLFLQSRELLRVATIWMMPGVVVWLIYVVPTWSALISGPFNANQLMGVVSSTLAHVGGLAVALMVLRRIGMDRKAWLYAFGWYFVLQLFSRLLTPAALNINLSQRIQDGWEQTFSSYLRFWLVLTIMVGLGLWVLGAVLRLIWPAKPKLVDAGESLRETST
jgi:hypothetical protein